MGGRVVSARVQVLCPSPFGAKTLSACSFERIVHMKSTPVEMQSFATVRSVVVWAQLEGDPSGVAEQLGVEFDDHPRVPVLLENWDDATAIGPHLSC